VSNYTSSQRLFYYFNVCSSPPLRTTELLFATYKCTNCQETISGVRVQCHEPSCQDVMLVLCLQCFASGAELGPHKNSHPYSFNVRMRPKIK